uniref:Uncharacterized protein n=1 Tax=viral metagenome TaxID=1070528 RepID=A0A6M3JLZ8_9ZZZZ
MTKYWIEKDCPTCQGQGCERCEDTGAVSYEVTVEEFYRWEPKPKVRQMEESEVA